MAKWLTVIAITFLGVGCSSRLEDGYKPQLLGVSDAQRRAYYASPFTPEAKAASMEREQEFDARRPRPGY